MAGIITISRGRDAAYPWRRSAQHPHPTSRLNTRLTTICHQPRKAASLPASGTVPVWRELGLKDGHIIDRNAFEQLYGLGIDPRDPSGETRLGRKPQQFRSAEEILETLAALEPEATPERRAELMIEAKAQVRTLAASWIARARAAGPGRPQDYTWRVDSALSFKSGRAIVVTTVISTGHNLISITQQTDVIGVPPPPDNAEIRGSMAAAIGALPRTPAAPSPAHHPAAHPAARQRAAERPSRAPGPPPEPGPLPHGSQRPGSRTSPGQAIPRTGHL